MSANLSEATLPARERLVALAHRYHRAGWMLGTAGNLSARVGERVVITASGRDKGAIGVDDFVEVHLSGAVVAAPDGARPSAETSIHLALYDRVPRCGAVLHVHTVASTLARPPGALPAEIDLTGFEMVKGWGLWDEGAEARLPVFPNHADVPKIADDLQRWYEVPRSVPAMLIAGHGLTAWGEDLDSAHRHVEITEFLCQLVRAQGPITGA